VAALETIPPDWVFHPEVYDANHCLLPPPDGGGVICPPPAMPGWTPDPNDPGGVWGYQGTPGLSVRILKAGAVILLDGSVSVTSSGPWRALGLVRNETTKMAGAVTIRATLYGVDGAMIETVSAPSLVDPIRPGEPAPFVLQAKADASLVAAVDWAIDTGHTAAAPVPRQIIIALYWWRPYGDRERIDWPGVSIDPPAPPYPYFLVGSMRSYAPKPLRAMTAVIAYADEAGRIIWAGTATPIDPPGGRPGDLKFVDFYVEVDDPAIAPKLMVASPLWWGIGQ
jgi:hypothetical protein